MNVDVNIDVEGNVCYFTIKVNFFKEKENIFDVDGVTYCPQSSRGFLSLNAQFSFSFVSFSEWNIMEEKVLFLLFLFLLEPFLIENMFTQIP